MVCCTCCGIALVSFCMILLPDKGDKIRHPCNFGRELMGMVITFLFFSLLLLNKLTID